MSKVSVNDRFQRPVSGNDLASKRLPPEERPMYRLYHNDVAALTLAELLAVIIGGGNQIEIAYAILAHCGSLLGIVNASTRALTQVNGLGPRRAAAIKAALELGRRLTQEEAEKKPRVQSPHDVAALLTPDLAHADREHFVLLLLNARGEVIGKVDLQENTPDQLVGNILREALRYNSAAIIVVHNRACSAPTLSPEDITLARNLVLDGILVGVGMIDLVVYGNQQWISLHEERIIP